MKILLIFLFLGAFFSTSYEKMALGNEELIYQGDDGDKESLGQAIDNSLNYLSLKIAALNSLSDSSEKRLLLISLQKNEHTLKRFQQLFLKNLYPEAFAQKIQEEFKFRPLSKKGIKLTGYFEPIYSGSLQKEGEFKYPLYRPPDDLVEVIKGINDEKKFGRMVQGRLVPYYSREEIDKKGVLHGKGYEIFWLKDPWERFILHVQGSGQIKLVDGQIYVVKYIASNGRPYRSIGQYLVKKGHIAEQELSLRKVKEFFQKNPHLMEEYFNLNERYIFFQSFPLRKRQGPGPVGALELPLVPGRSIAIDHSVYPPGGLCYLVSTMPVIDKFGQVLGRKKINRFVLNQDKGAAMRGASRVDLFIGSGEEAGLIAGEMNEEGKIFALTVK
ncbi:MAG: MltA domain-containing protein [Thermodesulfobacteriota bacterium]